MPSRATWPLTRSRAFIATSKGIRNARARAKSFSNSKAMRRAAMPCRLLFVPRRIRRWPSLTATRATRMTRKPARRDATTRAACRCRSSEPQLTNVQRCRNHELPGDSRGSLRTGTKWARRRDLQSFLRLRALESGSRARLSLLLSPARLRFSPSKG